MDEKTVAKIKLLRQARAAISRSHEKIATMRTRRRMAHRLCELYRRERDIIMEGGDE